MKSLSWTRSENQAYAKVRRDNCKASKRPRLRPTREYLMSGKFNPEKLMENNGRNSQLLKKQTLKNFEISLETS